MRVVSPLGVVGWRDGRLVGTVDVLFTSSDIFVGVNVKFIAEGAGAFDKVVLREFSTVALELTLPLSPRDKVKIYNISVSQRKTQYKYKQNRVGLIQKLKCHSHERQLACVL